MKPTRTLLAAALLLAFTTVLSADPLTVGVWQVFSWEALGPIDEGQYTFDATPYANGLSLRVVDCAIIGDQFHLNVLSGVFEVDTSDPSAWDGIDSGASDGDAAWADPRLSHNGEIDFRLGPFTLDISVIRMALDTEGGGAFVRLDPVVPSSVPEPATFGLLGAALAGLTFLCRRPAR